MIATGNGRYVAVYDNESGVEQRTPVIVWQEHDLKVYGLVEQEGYPLLKPAIHLPGFLRYEPCGTE